MNIASIMTTTHTMLNTTFMYKGDPHMLHQVCTVFPEHVCPLGSTSPKLRQLVTFNGQLNMQVAPWVLP